METDDRIRLEVSSILDNTLTDINNNEKEALYTGIKEYEEFQGSL